MTRARQALALVSLGGLFLSSYLYLYKTGAIGSLSCGSGGCDLVQFSRYSRFLGVEVSLIGALGYAALFGLSLLALQPRFAGPAWPSRLLVLLAGVALLFSVYLTAMELFVIHAICRYCVASALLVTLLFGLAVWDLRRKGTPAA